MAQEKKALNEMELENASGGKAKGLSSHTVTVTNCAGTYVALRSSAIYNPNNEIAKLHNGDTLVTNDDVVAGSGINNAPCYYLKAAYNGMWGYINTQFVV